MALDPLTNQHRFEFCDAPLESEPGQNPSPCPTLECLHSTGADVGPPFKHAPAPQLLALAAYNNPPGPLSFRKRDFNVEVSASVRRRF
jgi:hypothetical protein